MLCALPCEGMSLEDAVRCANAASALAVTRSGPATCPDRNEVELLGKGVLKLMVQITISGYIMCAIALRRRAYSLSAMSCGRFKEISFT
nr:hypothetical protein [Bifidobacterium catenulatum]